MSPIFPFGDNFFTLAKKIVKAWIEKDSTIRKLFKPVFISFPVGIIISILAQIETIPKQIWEPIGIGILGIVLTLLIIIVAFQSVKDDKQRKTRIEEKEEDLEKHPEKSATAWELANIKLESYLNRNLSQVRWIFFWTILVMIAGFVMIGYGIIKVYEEPTNLQPSILVTVAGVLTELIGATFLFFYKSTMNQAKDYVNVLERINAVGMSIQILETMSSTSNELKDATKADLAKELLQLYGKTNK